MPGEVKPGLFMQPFFILFQWAAIDGKHLLATFTDHIMSVFTSVHLKYSFVSLFEIGFHYKLIFYKELQNPVNRGKIN
jgi:hypothetical protein